MELLQLKYFQVVAKLENVTRAAEELHVAQPSLSKTIARLESDVGVPLFERQGKRLKLNQFGKIFLKRVERILKELEEGKREIRDLAGLECGSVTVGATTSRLLPNLFSKYLKYNPNVKFRLFQVSHQLEIEERLMNGEFDLCISSMPINKIEIHCEPLINEEIFLAVPPGHRLAKLKNIQLSEIANEPFICMTTECGLRELTNDFCLKAGFTANIAFESNNAEVICSLVKSGFGNAFIQAYWWDGPNTESLGKLHIEDPICQRTIWLSWVKDRYLSEAANDFKNFILEYFRKKAIDSLM
ncbi:MAG: LysR family transcriptional regulator [Thermoanaerobacterium sp.]|nr:LysR family transcriptional regulator [Thermoanaerobacterium sp.]